MPDGEEVVMIMTARSIHEARPGFGSQVRCLCVAVISPRNKKNVCQPGLILFIGLFWGLCIVLAVWLLWSFAFWQLSRCVAKISSSSLLSMLYGYGSYSFSCVAVSQSVSKSLRLSKFASALEPSPKCCQLN